VFVNALVISPVLILAALASMLVPWPNRAGRIVVAICGGLIAFVPAFGTTPGQFLLGTMGPVSAATMVFIVVFVYALITRQYDRLFPSRAFLICVLVIGIVFYTLTIGLTTFDPYDLGYRDLALPTLMLLLVAIGWVARVSDIPCWVGLAALLFLLDAYGSRNLWDYLICPVDVVFAVLDLIIVALWRPKVTCAVRAT
jgi:hypothetical protein